MSFNHILLQAAPAGPNPMFNLVIFGGMIAVMYFVVLRPQSKRAKEQKLFADAIGAGDYVITTAGIHGTIQRTNEDGTIQVEIGRGNTLKLERSAISMEMTAAYRKKNNVAAAPATESK